ncbi:hypothetical protein GGD56_006852 [Rhizobium mongolense]|uniref:Uncharacterized protein n=1 Tax=Rhizobium mongolense TaxID=57676 RepID=A0ABR6IYH4_9HYPH|nr:hypothetical protein [Rhizobium mongolense]
MIDGIRENLNDPLPIQFFHRVQDVLGGNFGTSIFAGRPVLELMSQRLEPTVSLSTLDSDRFGYGWDIVRHPRRVAIRWPRRPPPHRLLLEAFACVISVSAPITWRCG